MKAGLNQIQSGVAGGYAALPRVHRERKLWAWWPGMQQGRLMSRWAEEEEILLNWLTVFPSSSSSHLFL